MGKRKRNKPDNAGTEDSVHENQAEGSANTESPNTEVQISTKKKKTKTDKEEQASKQVEDTKDVPEPSKKRKAKNKHDVIDPADDSTPTQSNTVSGDNRNNSKTKVAKKSQNKKIIFVGDEPVAAASVLNKKETKKKNFLNEDEAEVKDEDIDKFCDELEDDDNVHYENWVKLIEDKLHSKSKKNK